MNRSKKFRKHLKAFLLSHQIGEDPKKYIARLTRIANTDPDEWDGKLPKISFKPDLSYCKVVESAKKRLIVPWWWYAQQNEPVPSVVEEIYNMVAFDFVLMFPQVNAWIYIIVEPEEDVIELLKMQDHMKAFILISLINKNFNLKQRELKRLHMGKVIRSNDIRKIFTFVAVRSENQASESIIGDIPLVTRVVDNTSNTTSWRIIVPHAKQPYDSFKELISGM